MTSRWGQVSLGEQGRREREPLRSWISPPGGKAQEREVSGSGFTALSLLEPPLGGGPEDMKMILRGRLHASRTSGASLLTDLGARKANKLPSSSPLCQVKGYSLFSDRSSTLDHTHPSGLSIKVPQDAAKCR